MSYAQIALNIGVHAIYTYGIPEDLQDRIVPGTYVSVPFGRGNRFMPGFCTALTDEPVKGMKNIKKALSDGPLISSAFLQLCEWISSYYECPLGEVLAALVPAGVKKRTRERLPLAYSLTDPLAAAPPGARKQRAVIACLKDQPRPMPREELLRAADCSAAVLKALEDKGLILRNFIPVEAEIPVDLKGETVEKLTDEQETALTAMHAAIDSGGFKVLLLKGVTGSGKTELYLRAIERVVAAGRQAIMLVPEIVLTPQMHARFSHRFNRVAMLHSRLSAGERSAIWKGIRDGNYDVIIGPRSALFAPLPAPGIFIVDEEHENTFKQESAPRYHARDVAVYMGSQLGLPVVLGSATPSLESLHNAAQNRYDCLTLSRRVAGYDLPEMGIIDLAREFAEKKQYTMLSLPLRQRMEETLGRDEQTILFINQRGFARYIFCPMCGKPIKCKRCDITLTYHKPKDMYLCHYCDFREPAYQTCPVCEFKGLKHQGSGTQKLEEELARFFPDRVTQRMDSDSMTAKSVYKDVLTRFARNEINILVGTQIVAKGLDFPNVTTVGIMGIENILNLPDFRSPERTFQMISQVAGRAGRGAKKGKVMVEVFNPQHYAIDCALTHDLDRFFELETQLRRDLNYPPFGSLVRVLIEGPDFRQVTGHAANLKRQLLKAEYPRKVQVLGPAQAPLAYINQRHRWHILIKVPDRIPLNGLFNDHSLFANKGSLKITVDVDPVSML